MTLETAIILTLGACLVAALIYIAWQDSRIHDLNGYIGRMKWKEPPRD